MKTCRKTAISRRKFLKGAATLGVTALTQHLLDGVKPPKQAVAAPEAPRLSATPSQAQDFDHHVYVPLDIFI